MNARLSAAIVVSIVGAAVARALAGASADLVVVLLLVTVACVVDKIFSVVAAVRPAAMAFLTSMASATFFLRLVSVNGVPAKPDTRPGPGTSTPGVTIIAVAVTDMLKDGRRLS